MKRNLQKPLSERISLFLASGLGMGYIPPMPGTLGSIEGIILAYFTKDFSSVAKFFILIVIIILGIFTSEVASKSLEDEDPDEVVIDEIAGSYISVFVAQSILEFGVAFVLFRIIDIAKPYPIRLLERFKGGFGIMMDDLSAGALTTLLLFLIIMIKNTLW